MSALLQVEHLTIQFAGQSHPVVDDLSYQLHRGQCLAIVGESGSGKTLSGLALLQLLPETARISNDSSIQFQQRDLLNLSEQAMRAIRGAKIAMIFQDALAAFNPVYTVGFQIDEVLRLHQHLPRSARQQRAYDLLQEVGIEQTQRCYQSYPHQLSGGQRQRAMIALALACEPDVLIADEPCTALDVTIQQQVLSLLRRLQQEHQLALVFISHDLAVVKQMADDVLVMQKGRCVERAKANVFYQNPTSPYAKELLAAIPDLSANLKPDPEADILVEARELKVYFPIKKGLLRRTRDFVKAVDNVELVLSQGQTLALVGESGSGKSTLAKTVVGLLPPTSGEIKRHCGFDAMQMIFQDPYGSLDPRMMVLDCLMEGLKAQGKAGSYENQCQLADQLLQQVGLLPEYKWRYPHQFSGGQRQRICIARALAMSPRCLILDEPTSALDVSVQMQILQLLRQLQQELNISYLLITHNLGVVAYLAHSVAVMYHGSVVEAGPVQQVLEQPKQPYTQQLLAAVPSIVAQPAQ